MTTRRTVLGALASSVLSAGPLSRLAFGAELPPGPLKMICPLPPGGAADLSARFTGEAMKKKFPQRTFLIENVPGGNGVIALRQLVQAKPDGTTLLLGSTQTNSTNFSLVRNYGFKADDFKSVCGIGTVAGILATKKDLPVQTLGELIALAKKQPGKLTYAAGGGIGSFGHMLLELLKNLTGTNIRFVPYRGSGEATMAAASGHTDMVAGAVSTIAPACENGSLRALVLTGPSALAATKGVPTFADLGMANEGYAELAKAGGGNWYGVMVSAQVSQGVVEELHQMIASALDDDEIRARLNAAGITPWSPGPQALQKYVDEDIQRWATVIKAGNIELL